MTVQESEESENTFDLKCHNCFITIIYKAKKAMTKKEKLF